MTFQMNRRSFLTTSGIAGALFLAGCSTGGTAGSSASSSAAASTGFETNGPKPISEKAKEANTADKDGVLTVGFDQEFPPYGYVGDDGVYTGFDLYLAAEVAARNGWNLNCVALNWDAKDTELNSGAIDCIWNGFTIEGREDGYAFTKPYMDNSQVVVVRKDAGITKLADLAGKTVMVQTDSAAEDVLSAEGDQAELAKTFKAIQTTPDYNTAMMELESGAVDAIGIDEPVAKFQIAGRENTFTILEEPLSTEHYGVGFAKSNTEERDVVEKTLIEMFNDGTVKKIAEKYADQGINMDAWILK